MPPRLYYCTVSRKIEKGGRCAYTNPKASMTVASTFCFKLICNLARMNAGTIAKAKSDNVKTASQLSSAHAKIRTLPTLTR